MTRALTGLWRALTRSLLGRFLLVVIPLFVALSTAGLGLLIERDLQGERDHLAARFGNLAARTATVLSRIDIKSEPRLAEGILGQVAADQAFVCAELRSASTPTPVAVAPARIGCKGQSPTSALDIAVRGQPDYSLHVAFTDAEIVAAEEIRQLAALGAIAIGFLVAVLSAAIGFRIVVQRRLGRLLASIQLASALGERQAVARPGSDDLGTVINAYNEMLAREEGREAALEKSNAAYHASEARLRQLNDELEGRVRERTAELVSARDRAEAMSRAKSDFLAHMSHEIRTPLNGLLGMVELLKLTALDQTQARYAEIMQRSGDTLMALVNNVLDLSKVEAGKLELERRAFDLRQVLQDVAAIFDEPASRKGIAITLVANPNQALWVMGDSVRLGQVVTNLTGNALKFTSTGSIGLSLNVIEASQDAATVRISVSDTGIGISPENQARIFEAFEQADRSTTRRFGGTGLGLAISKQIVEAMGGTLSLASTSGQGSRFDVTLTLALADSSKAATREKTGATLPAPRRGLRCLLVEDNEVNRIVSGTILESLGIAYDTAENGLVAFERAIVGGYDLILMDCQMPEMDGYEATRRIRAHEADTGRPRVPIIALTANVMTSDIEKCLASGMDGHTPKPVNRTRMMEVLAKFAPAGVETDALVAAVLPQMPANACFDETALSALRAINSPAGASLVDRVASSYFSSAPNLLADIERAAAASDLEVLRRAAHTLKSSSAYLGLIEVSDLARTIEAHAKAGELDAARSLLSALSDAMARGEHALRAALAQPERPFAAA